MSEAEDFNFDDIDFKKVAFDEMAKMLVPLFQALKANGLNTAEAAALAANYWMANVAQAEKLEGPQDGS